MSIIASSVSSERAFSQGGITISKHYNCLKGDIVEALQCVKCTICHDIFSCELEPSSLLEDESDEFEIEVEPGANPNDDVEEEGWNNLFLEEDDEFESEDEMDES